MKGAMIRSRRNWIAQGEHNCAYFYKLEKYNYMSKNRFKLRNNAGQITTDPSEILELQKQFYENLYRTDNTIMSENYLQGLAVNKLTDSQCNELDAEISSLEIRKAITDLNKGKCPGNNGFGIEWYLKFYDKLKSLLLVIFRQISRYGLPDTSKRGIISLLEKPGRDKLNIKDWRPLSLLNCDGKIYGKILANRTYGVIDEIVSKDQYGFLKKCFIGKNLLDLLSSIDYCRKYNINALVVSLDIEKAFDRIEWDALIKILSFFNFGPKFCHMVQMLYQGTTSCTINNGYTSEYFQLQRALRQGCPYSPPAFLLIAEILGQKIKQNDKIQGITIGNSTKKSTQYALLYELDNDFWVNHKR